MSAKLENLYKSATGTHPRDLEPKPSHAQMVKVINREKQAKRINQTVIFDYRRDCAPESQSYDITVDWDGDGTYTQIFDKVNFRTAFLDGDQSQNLCAITNIGENEWIYMPRKSVEYAL